MDPTPQPAAPTGLPPGAIVGPPLSSATTAAVPATAVAPPTGLPPGAIVGPPLQQSQAVPATEASAPTSDYLSKTEDAIQTGVKGIGEAAGDVWSVIKGIPGGIARSLPPVEAYDRIKESIPLFQAYEEARTSGKGIVDSLSAANEQFKKQDAATQMLAQRAEEFKKAPGQESVRALADAGALALSIYLGGKAMGPAAAAPEAEAAASAVPAAEVGETATATAAPKPGLIKQAIQGEKVAQPQAQTALKEAGTAAEETATARSGTAPAAKPTATEAPSVRNTLTTTVKDIQSRGQGIYRQLDEATGGRFQRYSDQIDRINNRMDSLVEGVDDDQISSLEQRKAEVETSQAQMFEDLKTQKGIDPKVIDEANAHYKQAQALKDVDARVFKNPSIVGGNAAHGSEEVVNVDNAVKALQKLQDNTRYGGPRLEQAFGKQGAKELLDQLYDAQRMGAHAMKLHNLMGKVVKYVGYGAGGYLGLHLAREVVPGQ